MSTMRRNGDLEKKRCSPSIGRILSWARHNGFLGMYRFDADFNYTSTGNIEARNREAYIERHTEDVPIAGEVWPKIW